MEPKEEGEKVAVKRVRRRPFFMKISFWLFVAVIVLGYLYYTKTKDEPQNPLAQAGVSEDELQKVTDEMKAAVVASSGDEIKILGIIDDPEQLRKEQAFYKDVEKGDYVFIFTGTSRALIWRPSDKKIVNFGVFEVRNEQATAPEPATEPKKK